MKQIIFIIIFLMISTMLFSKEITNGLIIEPFTIDDKYLSGMDIPKSILKADPERDYYQKRIYKGSELSVYILSSETTLNEISNFPFDEFVYYINGRADVEAKNSDSMTFYSGDYFFVPKGYSGNWTNNGGNKLHLELSVISNKRADSTKQSIAKKPFLLDRELMSGIGLTKYDSTKYKNVLYSGVELDVLTESEVPNKREINKSEKEIFVHILTGSLTVHPQDGEPQTYLKGDFFILPIGFSGIWEINGKRLLRTLKVMQTKNLTDI